jgi:fibro-slime domain-containing protein
MKIILAFILLTFVLQVLSQSTLSLTGTLYDFKNSDSGGHPDFNFNPICGLVKGLVEQKIGEDRKPVLSSMGQNSGCMHGKTYFDQWFRSTPGVNYVFPDYTVTAYWDSGKKSFVYNNNNFFPLDTPNTGFGTEGKSHNYGFCFELHNTFTYVGGEQYWFQGDDDVWVFINDQLVIDLGGVHGPSDGTVNLDSLGLTVDQTYNFDFFFCERHESGSNMAFSTTVKLDPCGTTDTDGDGTPDLCDNCPTGNLNLEFEDSTITGTTATVYVKLNNNVRSGVTVTFDWGDGQTEDRYITIDSSITHKYEKEGTYTVTASFTGAGCGSDTETTECKIGSRIAPSCVNRILLPQ